MKSVGFNLELNKTFITYSLQEYDRLPIQSILYMKCYNKISTETWNQVLYDLNIYKTREMIIHKSSICNTKLHIL